MTIQVATRSALRSTPRLMTIFSSLLVALATLAAAAASFQPFADPRLLFMDVIAGAQASGYCCRGYYGVMSSLGAISWALAAGTALFAALCLWSRGEAASRWLSLAFGGALSLADLHLVPILDYFARTEDGRAALARHPRLSAWWSRMEPRPSVAGTRPNLG